jgi:hypothetical protein
MARPGLAAKAGVPPLTAQPDRRVAIPRTCSRPAAAVSSDALCAVPSLPDGPRAPVAVARPVRNSVVAPASWALAGAVPLPLGFRKRWKPSAALLE